jgi:hypothetical protein
MRRLLIWAAAAVLMSLAGSSARADSLSAATPADETFLAGKELLKDKRYAEACAKFQESQSQDPASGTLLALAYCQELSGLLASSWASYVAAANLAQREGHPERQAAANERAQALAGRVSKLTVIAPSELVALPGFRLTLNGGEFERASLGVAVPLDGGSHVLTATAPGRVAWTSTVSLLPEHDQKTLLLPNLDVAEPPPVASPPPAPSPQSPLPPPASNSPDVKLQRVSLALAAGSVVALGLGTAFGLSAKSKNDASNSDGHCDAHGCDAQGVQLRNDSLTAARVSTWSFVAGGALAAASITLYLESNHSQRAAGSAKLQASVSLAESRVSLTESF